MIVAAVILIAGELAVFTERRIVEIVAVAIDMILGKIFIVLDVVLIAEFARFGPSLRLDFEELDIGRIICFANQKVAKLVKKEELWLLSFFGSVIEVVGRRELETFAGAYL